MRDAEKKTYHKEKKSRKVSWDFNEYFHSTKIKEDSWKHGSLDEYLKS